MIARPRTRKVRSAFAKPTLTRDGSVDLTQPVGNAFDDILDELHSTTARPKNAPDANEHESLVRAEQEFMLAFANYLRERLRPKGFERFRVTPDDVGMAYVVRVLDREGREYTASFAYDSLIETLERKRDLDTALFPQVVTAILAARDNYFKRMGREVGA